MTKETIVIGAGMVGICCALSLVQRGEHVRLIDRNAPAQGASTNNAGVISPWSIAPQASPGLWKKLPGMLLSKDRPLAVQWRTWPRMTVWGSRFLLNGSERRFRAISDAMKPLCGPSIELYRRHLSAAGTNAALVQDSCYIHAFRTENGADLSTLEYRVRAEAGAKMERVGAGALRELEPDLGPAFKSAILIRDQARAMAPGRIGEILAGDAHARGAAIDQADVQALDFEGDTWAVRTGAGTYRAHRVVLAAGAWSADLLRPLGVRLPLIAERGYRIEFAGPGVQLNHSVMDMGAKVVASSMDGGLRVAGAAEFGPLDAKSDPRREQLMRRQARQFCPQLSDGAGEFRMGVRPTLPDGLPALGEVRGAPPRLFAAFGHSHYGLMMAPATGEIVADIVTGRATELDLTPYDPRRFG